MLKCIKIYVFCATLHTFKIYLPLGLWKLPNFFAQMGAFFMILHLPIRAQEKNPLTLKVSGLIIPNLPPHWKF